MIDIFDMPLKNITEIVGIIAKALRSKPEYVVILVIYLLALVFGKDIVNSFKLPYLSVIFICLIVLFPFFITYIVIKGNRVNVKEYSEDESIHQNLNGDWKYIESVITKYNGIEKISGTVNIQSDTDFQIILTNGTQKNPPKQSWQSIHAGWVGEKIFVYYTVINMETNVGSRNNSWQGFILLNVVYNPQDKKTITKMSGNFYTIGKPRIGTITLTRTPA
jgi:hypothetical protein